MVKIWHIIKGTYNNIFNKFSKLSIYRMSVCATCPKRKHIWGFGHYCSICGCIIKSKVTIDEEKCPNGRW